MQTRPLKTSCHYSTLMRRFLVVIGLLLAIAVDSPLSEAQAKRRTSPLAKPTPQPVEQVSKPTEGTHPSAAPKKQNLRPQVFGEIGASQPAKPKLLQKRLFYYEFTQPDFVVSRIIVTHDDDGKGEISFRKSGFMEMITEPIEISPTVMERIESALARLNFLESDENYQFEKDFSHLGNIKIRLTVGERSREAAFNWTENPDAKLLKDEYRRISNQFLWIFEIGVARENQPLESPRLMKSLDSLLKRNEVADSAQMLPFLRGLTDDERLPLIARNHAAKLAKQIERQKK